MQETQNNKKTLIGITVGAILIVLLFLAANYFSSRNGDDSNLPQNATSTGAVEADSTLKTAFLCDDGYSMSATFTENAVALNLSDKRNITLTQVDVALGARFQNADNTIALIVLGPSASLEENGTVTHADCIQPKG